MNSDAPSPKSNCAACPLKNEYDRRCATPEGRNPKDCPTVRKAEMVHESLQVYRSEAFSEFTLTAARVERACYDAQFQPTRPRIVELVDFARRMGYAKLGLLFCVGLRKEAVIAREILETNGFEVVSAICKVGCIPKTTIGLRREEQINPKREAESLCNPVMQAMIANEAGVDFNILLGLCVGHDSLVLAHLEKPATILAVKDRLLGHNPLAAIYQYDAYYAYLKNPLPLE